MQESENGAADIGGEIVREALAAVRCRLIRGIVRLGRNPVVSWARLRMNFDGADRRTAVALLTSFAGQ